MLKWASSEDWTGRGKMGREEGLMTKYIYFNARRLTGKADELSNMDWCIGLLHLCCNSNIVEVGAGMVGGAEVFQGTDDTSMTVVGVREEKGWIFHLENITAVLKEDVLGRLSSTMEVR